MILPFNVAPVVVIEEADEVVRVGIVIVGVHEIVVKVISLP